MLPDEVWLVYAKEALSDKAWLYAKNGVYLIEKKL